MSGRTGEPDASDGQGNSGSSDPSEPTEETDAAELAAARQRARERAGEDDPARGAGATKGARNNP